MSSNLIRFADISKQIILFYLHNRLIILAYILGVREWRVCNPSPRIVSTKQFLIVFAEKSANFVFLPKSNTVKSRLIFSFVFIELFVVRYNICIVKYQF